MAAEAARAPQCAPSYIRLFLLKRVVAFALAFAIALVPAISHAQSDTGAIAVTVVDAASNAPLAGVRVFLTGVVTATALTTRAGVVRYTDVPTGIYRVRVSHAGYDVGLSHEFEVLGGKAVALRFGLSQATKGLRVIGAVTVRPTVQVNTNQITGDSAVRRISDSLLQALSALPGVDVTQSSNDPDAVVTISLNGHDESQTAIAVDGVPLSAPGVAANLRSISSDLFTSASTSFAPTAAGLGGTVSFRTLEPTQSWNERVFGSDGTFDHWNYNVAATGSIGPLGIAVMHASRGANTPLTFQTFADTSGLTYAHGGFSTLDGDFVKLRYRLGDSSSLTGAYLTSNNAISLLCTLDVTILPCGYGPGNSLQTRFALGYGTFASLIGNVALTATAYSADSHENDDELNRVLDGAAFPFETTTQRHTGGYAVTASLPQHKHTFTLSGNTFRSLTTFDPLVTASEFVVPSAVETSATTLQLVDTVQSSDKLALNFNVALANDGGIGASLLEGAGATWNPAPNDLLRFAAAYGSAQPGSTAPKSLSNPYDARFDCTTGTTLVTGPGDSPQRQSSSSYNLDWTHGWHGGQLTVDAYRQRQSGQTINGYVNALGEPPGFLPGGYIDQLELAWSQASVCGSAPFSPLGIYVNQPISGTSRLYEGLDASARIQLGNYVVLLPAYALNVATLLAADPRFAVPGSMMIVGAQLPGRPIHRAALTADVLVPRTHLEILLSGQYTGSNNNRELTPFATVAAGLSYPLGPGRLTVFASNLFNADAGTFSTLQYAQPIPLVGGATNFAAYPLPPRQWNVSYAFALGKGATAGSTLEEQAQQAARANAAPSEPGGPGSGTGMGGPGGPGSGTGGGRFHNILPQGGDPFALAQNPACDAPAQDVARPVLQMLRDYVAAYEARRPLPATPNFTITAHPQPATPPYWLDVEPIDLAKSPLAGRVRDIFACGYIAVLTQQQARSRGIVTGKGVFLGYAPGVGIFRVLPRQLPPGGGGVR